MCSIVSCEAVSAVSPVLENSQQAVVHIHLSDTRDGVVPWIIISLLFYPSGSCLFVTIFIMTVCFFFLIIIYGIFVSRQWSWQACSRDKIFILISRFAGIFSLHELNLILQSKLLRLKIVQQLPQYFNCHECFIDDLCQSFGVIGLSITTTTFTSSPRIFTHTRNWEELVYSLAYRYILIFTCSSKF